MGGGGTIGIKFGVLVVDNFGERDKINKFPSLYCIKHTTMILVNNNICSMEYNAQDSVENWPRNKIN